MNGLVRRILFRPVQASTVAEDIDWLHYFVILTTMAGATLVTVIVCAFLIIHRRGDHAPRAAHCHAPAAPPPRGRPGCRL